MNKTQRTRALIHFMNWCLEAKEKYDFCRSDAFFASKEALLKSLLDFSIYHDIDAMLRFRVWSLRNKMGAEMILVTVMHDLIGMGSKHFSPRTSSY